ncbi:kinase-like protein [Phellopilus nigrolimitatus]|nr:kinase-like protein [Phellopilus nigrolimitatus]
MLKEISIWRNLKHKNVLPFLGLCIDKLSRQMAIISPWMENEDLRKFLKRNPDFDRVSMVHHWNCRGLLTYLHTRTPPVVHGDLKCANVLVDSSDCPLISDFGLASEECEQPRYAEHDGCGSVRWQAPELLEAMLFVSEDNLRTRIHSTKTDVYAFAMTCLEVFTEQVPFPDLRDGAVIMEVVLSKKRPTRPGGLAGGRKPEYYVWEVIKACWQTNPSKRPTIEQAIKDLSEGHMMARAGDAMVNVFFQENGVDDA